jgi:phytoene desaturase
MSMSASRSPGHRSVIIIGAGLAGLAAGVYAQLNGYRAHIFEHAAQPGGVAVCWRRGDYLIDGGIHFLMSHRGGNIRQLYDELGTAAPHTLAELSDYGEFVDAATGRRLRITADLDRFAADWAALSPRDAHFARELVEGARSMSTSDVFGVGMGDPPELAGPLSTLRTAWEMRGLFRYFTGKWSVSAAERARDIQDPWLREVYRNLFLPEAPVWFLAMVLALLYCGQMGLLLGGSAGFVQPIAERYRALGGEITYNTTVDQILVQGDTARGVRLTDGSTHRSDAVISAADGRSTLFDMLGEKYLDDKWRARYRNWRLIRPMVMINYGVARTFDQDDHVRILSLSEPLVIAEQSIPALMLRIFNYSPHFAPPGHTVLQVVWDGEWEHWATLRADLTRYEAEKRSLAAVVLARLEDFYPGITSQVEVTDVATPYTTWRYTRNHHGAYEGWLPDAHTIMTALPRTLKGLAGFYMAGQWVVPGGGVPTCLLSGRDAVRIMCARDGRPFHNSRTG